MNSSVKYNRKELRELLKPYEAKNDALALRLCLTDYLLFFIGQYGVIAMPLALKPFASILVYAAIVRLFVLGHDACHGALASSRQLNQWLGRLVFLPSMTTFQGWTVTHNMLHHGFTNLAAQKDMWSPLSPDAYQALNSFERLRYRIYRNKWGIGICYLNEIWWKCLYFPSAKVVGAYSEKRFLADSLLVTCFLVIWLTSLYALALTTTQAYLPVLLLGFVLPFIVWNMTISYVTYLQHTHPKVHWYRNQQAWIASQPHITATVHIRFPQWLSSGIHHVMEHNAHHLDMNIPCYNLRAAQRQLEEKLPDSIVIQDFSWRWFADCTRICKLYDYEKQQWLSFEK